MSLHLLEQALMQEDLSTVQTMIDDFESDPASFFYEEVDEYSIRKMLIKSRILKAEIEKKKEMRDVVVAEWNRMIEKSEKQIDSIDRMVSSFIENQNGGKPLQLDVATASMRNVKASVQVKDKKAFELHLVQQQSRESFLKEPEVDFTKAKNDYLSRMQTEYPDYIPDGELDFMESIGLEYRPSQRTLSIRYN